MDLHDVGTLVEYYFLLVISAEMLCPCLKNCLQRREMSQGIDMPNSFWTFLESHSRQSNWSFLSISTSVISLPKKRVHVFCRHTCMACLHYKPMWTEPDWFKPELLWGLVILNPLKAKHDMITPIRRDQLVVTTPSEGIVYMERGGTCHSALYLCDEGDLQLHKFMCFWDFYCSATCTMRNLPIVERRDRMKKIDAQRQMWSQKCPSTVLGCCLCPTI